MEMGLEAGLELTALPLAVRGSGEALKELVTFAGQLISFKPNHHGCRRNRDG